MLLLGRLFAPGNPSFKLDCQIAVAAYDPRVTSGRNANPSCDGLEIRELSPPPIYKLSTVQQKCSHTAVTDSAVFAP